MSKELPSEIKNKLTALKGCFEDDPTPDTPTKWEWFFELISVIVEQRTLLELHSYEWKEIVQIVIQDYHVRKMLELSTYGKFILDLETLL